MNVMKTCLIVGKFAMKENILDGQTVKCKTIYDELVKKYGQENISYIDTYGWKKRPIKLFFNCFKGAKQYNNVIIMPAHNGVKIFSSLFSFLKKLFHTKIHYIVIGSWLFNVTQESKRIQKSLLKFDTIFVETKKLKGNLEKSGFKNIVLMRNYKNLKVIEFKKDNLYKNKDVLNLCIFSRINKEKGVLDAINTIKEINSDGIKFKLDIYGMIENEFKSEFFESLNDSKEYIEYKGIIDSQKSVDIISKYDILLFPTKYYTEGIPGTIIDAYASGVPVISSAWENSDDIVINNSTGLLFEFGNLNDFKQKLIYAYDNQQEMYNMKNKCIEQAKNFCEIDALNPLFKSLEE